MRDWFNGSENVESCLPGWRTCICLVVFFVLATDSVADQERESRFASATALGQPVSIFSEVALREVQLPNNEVAPTGFPIGKQLFVVKPGEKVEVVDIIPNDGESGHTCKVRNQVGKRGFVDCGFLEIQEWVGERGALVRILVEQPYEYEGDLAGPMEDIAKVRSFISQYPASRFVPFAKLEILSLRCGMTLDLIQDVWGDLRDIKERGRLGGSEAKIDIHWPPEASQLYASLEKKEYERLEEVLGLCSLVSKLQRSVPAPVTFVGEP
jgi:hypothetical protein